MWAVVGVLSTLTFIPRAAQAQQPRDIDLPRFSPAPAGDRFFGVPSPATPGELVLHGGVLLDYAHNPLILTDSDGNTVGHVVEHQLLLHLGVALNLFDRLKLSADLPLAVVNRGDGTIEAGQFTGANAFVSPSGAALGDLRLGVRLRLAGGYFDPLQIAVGASVWAPIGAKDAYISDGHFRAQPHLLLGGRIDRFIWAATGGPTFRTDRSYGGVQLGSQVDWGAAVGLLLGADREVQVGAETTGAVTLRKSASHSVNGEAMVGLKVRVLAPVEIGAAVGQGFVQGLGTPDFRGVFTLFYTPPVPEHVVEREPRTVVVIAPPDRDRDGILDRADACPDEVGVANADRKLNGCPRRDSDGDGIFDDVDACPAVRGVADADPKQNGCPPPDKDGDGIFDADDACPDLPGLKTDKPSTNGCPGDTDHDGFRDDQDACPQEKGLDDPDPAKRGCPKLVRVTRNEIVILEQIQFDTNKATIKPASGPLLDSIAQVMTEHPEITKIEVQGHTDTTGKPQRNTRLSQARAASAVQALVTRGIDSGRLAAKGYGQDIPIAPNDSAEGRQKNRRVQFVVSDRAPAAGAQ